MPSLWRAPAQPYRSNGVLRPLLGAFILILDVMMLRAALAKRCGDARRIRDDHGDGRNDEHRPRLRCPTARLATQRNPGDRIFAGLLVLTLLFWLAT